MQYNFDQPINRHHTNSLKYDFAVSRGRPADILPLWVADMDFPAPEQVLTALSRTVAHGIFGYSEPDKAYFEAIKGWFSRHYGWTADASKLALTCGVLQAISTLIRVLTTENDAILICQPVYYPFAATVTENRRQLIVSELTEENGIYQINFTDFEQKIIANQVKVFILCNPHNPVGRVWTKSELTQLAEICHRHGVFVISDEIHADFVYPGYTHTSFATLDLSRTGYARYAVCTAPTKTFNLAGLHIANTYIPDDTLHKQFITELDAAGYSQSGVMGIVACQAAYTYGDEWLAQLKNYLTENLAFIRSYLREKLPELRLVEPQGTYLLWLDFRKTGLSDSALQHLMTYKAGVWLDDGYIFGAGGNGFQRINIACPRSTLAEALDRIERALHHSE